MEVSALTPTIYLIAQIAITLIGFTGIVVALRGRTTGDYSGAENLQLFSLIVPAFITLACCFLPDLFYLLGLSNQMIWQISNGILGAAKLGGVLTYGMLIRRHQVAVSLSQQIIRSVAAVLVVIHMFAAANLIPYLEFIFVIGLIYPLVTGVSNFLLLIGLKIK